MTCYAPVAGSGGVIQGQQATEGGHFIENAGARREWWWQDGPVDSLQQTVCTTPALNLQCEHAAGGSTLDPSSSCCFCFNLRTGVGLLAGFDLIWGIAIMFFMDMVYFPSLELQLKASQADYSSKCRDHAAFTLDCGELEEANMLITGILFMLGFFYIIFGGVGLWAVSTCNPRAAEAFMLSFPAILLLKVVTRAFIHLWTSKGSVEQDAGAIYWLIYALDVVLLVYYFKVAWSYFKRSLDYKSARGRASSNAENQEQYMIAMTNVA